MNVREHYRKHVPPRWLRATVERLLASLPPEHLAGLESIVLTDAASRASTSAGTTGASPRS